MFDCAQLFNQPLNNRNVSREINGLRFIVGACELYPLQSETIDQTEVSFCWDSAGCEDYACVEQCLCLKADRTTEDKVKCKYAKGDKYKNW
jgi:hypothetical protein